MLNVPVLTALVATTQKDDHRVAFADKVEAIPRPVENSGLEHAASDRLNPESTEGVGVRGILRGRKGAPLNLG